MRLLDLFCGAGGAAVGYHRAGFEVVGVDLNPQPNFPFDFIAGDALLTLTTMIEDGRLATFDAIHASPPCQAYSVATKAWNGRMKRALHPDLVAPVRDALERTGLPFVIENVEGAPLRDPVKLCASTLDELAVPGTDGVSALRRHRLFEVNFPLEGLPCAHARQTPRFPPTRSDRHGLASVVSVFGAGGGRAKNFELWKAAMGIDWMTKREIAEAIPPAYTEWIGAQLLAHIERLPSKANAPAEATA